MIDWTKEYGDKEVLVIGGLGFLGSNIVNKAVVLGAKVTVLDNLDPRYGGNWFNVEGIKDKVKVVVGDIRDKELISDLVKSKDIIFSLAAQVSYIDSGNIPLEDLDVNCKGQLNILEACREFNPGAKIVFSSSRLALGKIFENPVTEDHPANPISMYGIHKFAAEKYYLLYYKNHGIRTTVLRITNPYGERQQIKHSKYGLPGWFMRLSMEGKPITIFGDGKQIRDYIHADDITEVFLRVAVYPGTDGEIYNCGSGTASEFREMAEIVVKAVGQGEVQYVPWPKNYEREETGDFKTDISKLAHAINWEPKISLKEGIGRMVEYYKKHKDKYINEA